jgi:lactoylglutathione lyase
MPLRAFPVVYSCDVPRLTAFYALLGFEKQFQFPPDSDEGYVSVERDGSSVGIVNADSPRDQIGVELGTGPRFEMFVYVEDVDVCVDKLRSSGVAVLSEPQDMPWGERLAYVSDPDGNPVALANAPA